MNFTDHSFDWRGFTFALKILFVFFVAVSAGHYGLTYALTYFAPTTPPTLAAVQIPPRIPVAEAATLSSTTPQRIINTLSIANAVPPQGKFIAADLVNMKLYLYQDGTTTAEYTIEKKGKPGTPWETPSGIYAIQTKEENHFSTIGKVYMPFSMQFYGNYFIHGMTYYPDGTPTAASFSGGCIKLTTEDAEKVFEFADKGTKVFVYDSKQTTPLPPLVLDSVPNQPLDAKAYLVADIDTGDVYAEQNAQEQRPIASVTKLMTALVANEIISLDKKVSVPEGTLFNPPNATTTATKTFLVDDLFYPLLMQSSNGIADALASYYGRRGFVGWMNTTAKALDMTSTTFADSSGISPDNISTTEDLFRLATYLKNKKSFVLKITDTQAKTITADDGSDYQIQNVNAPANAAPFEGGKVGHTTAAEDTMLSVLSFKVGTDTRRVAVIVLGSSDQAQDTKNLAEWIMKAATQGSAEAACVSCTQPPEHRKIEL
jgi:D-alanyl-D-alanine carboxypeptidase/lipoprotein-anchoring transpeptidase ErfK/SrfK